MSSIHTLHILNKGPEHPRSIACGQALKAGDALLLTENGVLALALSGSCETAVPVYALTADVMARGLSQCANGTIMVDFSTMVDMTAQAQNVISW